MRYIPHFFYEPARPTNHHVLEYIKASNLYIEKGGCLKMQRKGGIARVESMTIMYCGQGTVSMFPSGLKVQKKDVVKAFSM